jgi:hypothetical protein
MIEKINVGLWCPSILLLTPAPKCMRLSSGHVPPHYCFNVKEYKNVSVFQRGDK